MALSPYELRRLVVHCRRNTFDVYIGRPSKWGNPHPVGYCDLCQETHKRGEAVAKYRAWLLSQPQLVAEAKRELRGKVLGCWCIPQDCHGDVLAEVANTDEED
jgi:hypothetical protein